MFPARAGMSPSTSKRPRYKVRVPRASGDEPYLVSVAVTPEECSPRERG